LKAPCVRKLSLPAASVEQFQREHRKGPDCPRRRRGSEHRGDTHFVCCGPWNGTRRRCNARRRNVPAGAPPPTARPAAQPQRPTTCSKLAALRALVGGRPAFKDASNGRSQVSRARKARAKLETPAGPRHGEPNLCGEYGAVDTSIGVTCSEVPSGLGSLSPKAPSLSRK
jgi:hypothetical protein